MKIFLTGLPGSGKSTVLMKVIELLRQMGLKVGGIATPEMRESGRRTGFLVKDIWSEREGIMASVGQKTGPTVSKYGVDVKGFERIALPALDFAVKSCDVCCVDEIGRMEFFSPKFKERIHEIVKIDKPMIAVLHRDFVDQFRQYGKVIDVTPESRSGLPEEIVKKLQTLFVDRA